ncbi:MAG: hypothetical protein GXC76_09935 [Rhodanobacteraceae bacterium]|jgi:hypothetical protein|nr:hypothetical protein [Rhodanobacteraceae bacterium]
MLQRDLANATAELGRNNLRFVQRVMRLGVEEQQHLGRQAVALLGDWLAPPAPPVPASAGGDWTMWAAWPAELAWGLARRELACLRDLAEAAIGSQTAFNAGLQEALTDWQTERLRITSGALGDTRLVHGLKDMLDAAAQPPAPAGGAPA